MIGVPKGLSSAAAQPPIEQSLQPSPRLGAVSIAALHAGNRRRNRRRCRDRAPAPFRECSPDRCVNAIPPRTRPNKTSGGPWGTSRLHQRQRLRPLGPLGRLSRSAQPPGMVLLVLMELIPGFLQKIPKTEQDGAGTHLTVSGVLGKGCDQGCDSVYSAIARPLIEELCQGRRPVASWTIAHEIRIAGRRRSVGSIIEILVSACIDWNAGAGARADVRTGGCAVVRGAAEELEGSGRVRSVSSRSARITNPKTRLEKLQQWEKQYPMTEWI